MLFSFCDNKTLILFFSFLLPEALGCISIWNCDRKVTAVTDVLLFSGQYILYIWRECEPRILSKSATLALQSLSLRFLPTLPSTDAFLVCFWFLLTLGLPRCEASHINIHQMPSYKVNQALFSQQVIWLPGPSDNRLPHAVWKIPLFSGEIYEGGSVPLSSQQPLWSHSPLVDCLPNGHWQMGLKIASLAPLPQKPTVVGQHAAAFSSPNFTLFILPFPYFLCPLQIIPSYFIWPLSFSSCFFHSLHRLSEWKLIK